MRVIENKTCGAALFPGLDREAAEAARRYHRSLPNYRETPLCTLSGLAAQLGIRGLYVKDEGQRFGIGSFKALGAGYAAGRVLSERCGLECADYAALRSEAVREQLRQITLVTATDGNHGCGTAWAAQLLGCAARVFLPKGSAEERLQRIRSYGARAEITALSYDDCVRLAEQTAAATGGILLQDTAWEGYTEIPLYIMQGYLTMALEAYEQLPERPTHILLQAGVGSMAAAAAAFFASVYGDAAPNILIVEPEGAACLQGSAIRGRRYCCEGELHTMMAGLSCGEPSILAWEILRSCASAFVTIDDAAAAEAMVRLARPAGSDGSMEAGESGAAGVGGLLALLKDEKAKQALALDETAVVLCFNTECATDRANYDRILAAAGV